MSSVRDIRGIHGKTGEEQTHLTFKAGRHKIKREVQTGSLTKEERS